MEIKRLNSIKGIGKGWHKEIPRHQRVAREAWAKKIAKNSNRLSPIDPKNLIAHKNEIKDKKEIIAMDYEDSNKLDKIYEDEAENLQGYLTSGESNEVSGHQEELPYYRAEMDINFDGNAEYGQSEMNDAMSRLMDSVEVNLNELKDDMEFAWNSDADSYLSFGSAEVDMPKGSLPIEHYGDDDEAEIQLDSIEDEYERKNVSKLGVSLEQFKKYLKDNWSLHDDLIYVPVKTASVTYIPKEDFLEKIEGKADELDIKLDKDDLKIIKDYEA